MKITVKNASQIPQSWYGQTIGLDIETEDEYIDSDICLLQVYSPVDDVSIVVPIKAYFKGKLVEITAEELCILKEFLSTIKSVGHLLQFDVSRILYHWGVKVKIVEDTFLMSRIMQQDTNALKDIYTRLYPEKASKIRHFEEIKSNPPFVYNLDDRDTLQYAGLDPVLPFRIIDYFKKTFAREDVKRIYQLEIDFLNVAVDIQANGFNVDMDKFYKIQAGLEDVYQEKSSEFSTKVGFAFRCNSSADIERVLVDRMGLVPPLKTKKGKYSMSSECLEMMADTYDSPDIRATIETILKLKHDFSVVNSIKKVPNVVTSDNRIHSRVEQIGYDGTARVYTSNPSIQQFPAEFRECIVPNKGKKFLYMDWSAAEMYIAAYWGKCEEMLSYFRNGIDAHAEVSKRILGKAEITKEERNTSKVVSFATFYGSAGAAVARKLNCTNEEGAKLVDKYLSEYKEIKQLRSAIINYAHRTGATRTMMKRYRKLPNINSDYQTDVESSERQAFNTAIQGSCADFFKVAASRYKSFSDDVRFVVGVFDSFLFEVPEDWTEEQGKEFCSKISDFSDIFPDFNFRFKWAFGSNWKECADKT